jgi:hypothetical protein
MLVVDMSAVKLTGEVKQNNLPPECGQEIDVCDLGLMEILSMSEACASPLGVPIMPPLWSSGWYTHNSLGLASPQSSFQFMLALKLDVYGFKAKTYKPH